MSRPTFKCGFMLAALLAAGTLTGCADGEPFEPYALRIPTVTPTAGNAQAANTAIQTINPWPRYAYNTRIPGNGARMVNAVNCYERQSKDATGCPAIPAASLVGGTTQ